MAPLLAAWWIIFSLLFHPLLPSAAKAVLTPHGPRPAECVFEVPSGTTFRALEDGSGRVWFAYPGGEERFVDPPHTCHDDGIHERVHFLKERSRRSDSTNGWLDYAGWYPPAPENNLAAFTGTYSVPQNPPSSLNQVLFYFIGMQDNDNASINILQPVLTWGNGVPGWNAASWACCPNNITVHSTTITGFGAGDQLLGAIKRKDDYDWTILTEVSSGPAKGKSTTLNAQVGGYIYNWADVTLEVYNIVNCQEFAPGPMTFSDLSLTDSLGDEITKGAAWKFTGPTICQGGIKQVDDFTMVIEHSNN